MAAGNLQAVLTFRGRFSENERVPRAIPFGVNSQTQAAIGNGDRVVRNALLRLRSALARAVIQAS
jgi:hypothetical protein